MRCTNCGQDLSGGDVFCPFCGEMVQAASAGVVAGEAVADPAGGDTVRVEPVEELDAAAEAYDGVYVYEDFAEEDLAMMTNSMPAVEDVDEDDVAPKVRGRARPWLSRVIAGVVIILLGTIVFLVWRNFFSNKKNDGNFSGSVKDDPLFLQDRSTTTTVLDLQKLLHTTTTTPVTTTPKTTTATTATTLPPTTTTAAPLNIITGVETTTTSTTTTTTTTTSTTTTTVLPPTTKKTTAPFSAETTTAPTTSKIVQAEMTTTAENVVTIPMPTTDGGITDFTTEGSGSVSTAPVPTGSGPSVTTSVPLPINQFLPVKVGFQTYPWVRVHFAMMDKMENLFAVYDYSKLKIQERLLPDGAWVEQTQDVVFKDSVNLLVMADMTESLLQLVNDNPHEVDPRILRESVLALADAMKLKPDDYVEPGVGTTTATGGVPASATTTRVTTPVPIVTTTNTPFVTTPDDSVVTGALTTSNGGGTSQAQQTPYLPAVELPGFDKFGLIPFGESHDMSGGGFIDRRKDVGIAIAGLNYHGKKSYFYDAMQTALLQMAGLRHGAVVVFTLGVDSGSQATQDSIVQRARDLHVPINIIHITTEKPLAGAIPSSQLQQLAHSTKGLYRTLPARVLLEKPERLARELINAYEQDKRYQTVEYKAAWNESGGFKEHELRIVYTLEDGTEIISEPVKYDPSKTQELPEDTPGLFVPDGSGRAVTAGRVMANSAHRSFPSELERGHSFA